MKVHVNGNDRKLPGDIKTVSDLLSHHDLDNKKIIVELNEQIVDGTQYQDTEVKEGDRIELVQFVGGG
ncbi:sulfur carrier protein ThiS [Tenuibacillus multivorans]|uniref:Sulfur carrier protein n=1 Tax=Tenuibacillus multivorans TaxID=237069 RepID=A0A1H0DYL2_9BACI|nr:sulfur carrier protein ThiS [Tenuibacillus multivorans]GEL76723.1 sulfur carrier protein ThiS [Tenuibacillus multivorans]SDN75250.1 sulfur carrier protein [Tenuibacillus multivorans]